MPDKITLDEALSVQATSGDSITFDDALAERESQFRPAAGKFPGRGEMRITGEGLPGSPSYRPATIGPSPKPADQSNFGAAFKSEMVEDRDTQLRLVSESIGVPVERVGIVDGKPVFANDAGELQYVSGWGSRTGAAILGNSPEAAGAIAGALTPHPIAGSTLGAMGMRGLKRSIAGLVFDEPQTIQGNLVDIGIEGATNIATGGAGKGVTSLLNKGRIVDFTPVDLKTGEQARDFIKSKLGIDLDLAQASGNRKLLALRDYASRYPGKTAEMVQAADEIVEGQLDVATSRVLDLVAKAESSDLVGRRAINAAKTAIGTAREKVYDDVRPLYEAAFKAVPEVTDKKILGMLELPYFKQAFKSGQVMAELEGAALQKQTATKFSQEEVWTPQGFQMKPVVKEVDATKPDLRSLDYTKRALDDEIQKLKDSGARQRARALQIKRDEFVAAIDAIPNQQWQLARKRYGELIKVGVEPMEEGIVGIIAGISDQKAATVAAKLFSDPNITRGEIRYAKAQISQQDPDAWPALVRQWLGTKWNAALKETQGGDVINPAGKFRQAVYGTPDDKKKLETMLPPGAAADFDALMVAMEKLSRTPLGASRVSGSNTFRDTQISDELKGRVSVFAKALQPRRAVLDAAEQRAQEQGIEAITEALFDPAKRSQLKRIVKMQPSTKQALMITSLLGGQAATEVAADELSVDRMPLSQ